MGAGHVGVRGAYMGVGHSVFTGDLSHIIVDTLFQYHACICCICREQMEPYLKGV